MEVGNLTQVSEFILLGLSEDPKQQQLLFLLFLSMYLVTGLGNVLIILAIVTDPRLHTPMYFFLANLAWVDVCFTSTTVPKMLVSHVTGRKGIPYAGCLTQMFFFIVFVCLDSFLLGAMAYDRYEAVCHPLHYAARLTPGACALLLAACWAGALGNAVVHTALVADLSFCGRRRIPHFFCDVSPLVKLACSDTTVLRWVLSTAGAVPLFGPFLGVLVSYTRIGGAALGARGARKALSTCGSHLSVVCLFYGTLIGVYFNPAAAHSARMDTLSAVMYTVVTPMLNPFIYSLRNRDMKGALGALLGRRRAGPC